MGHYHEVCPYISDFMVSEHDTWQGAEVDGPQLRSVQRDLGTNRVLLGCFWKSLRA